MRWANGWLPTSTIGSWLEGSGFFWLTWPTALSTSPTTRNGPRRSSGWRGASSTWPTATLSLADPATQDPAAGIFRGARVQDPAWVRLGLLVTLPQHRRLTIPAGRNGRVTCVERGSD